MYYTLSRPRRAYVDRDAVRLHALLHHAHHRAADVLVQVNVRVLYSPEFVLVHQVIEHHAVIAQGGVVPHGGEVFLALFQQFGLDEGALFRVAHVQALRARGKRLELAVGAIHIQVALRVGIHARKQHFRVREQVQRFFQRRRFTQLALVGAQLRDLRVYLRVGFFPVLWGVEQVLRVPSVRNGHLAALQNFSHLSILLIFSAGNTASSTTIISLGTNMAI